MKCKHLVGHVCENANSAYCQMECPLVMYPDMCKAFDEKERPQEPETIADYLEACGRNKELCGEKCPWHGECENIKEDAAKAIRRFAEIRTVVGSILNPTGENSYEWRKTSEQMPSEDEGKILVRLRDGTILKSSGRILRSYESYSHKAAEDYPFWFPEPELPEGECL